MSDSVRHLVSDSVFLVALPRRAAASSSSSSAAAEVLRGEKIVQIFPRVAAAHEPGDVELGRGGGERASLRRRFRRRSPERAASERAASERIVVIRHVVVLLLQILLLPPRARGRASAPLVLRLLPRRLANRLQIPRELLLQRELLPAPLRHPRVPRLSLPLRHERANALQLRVEGPSFKATNVGVEFKGVRSGVERRRGASSGSKAARSDARRETNAGK